ncbi:MAG: lipid asymmetry maintenance protein MlaB [Methylococcaceae bacterium]
MAEKEDKGLIGFDPLAWMNEESEATDEASDPIETQTEVTDLNKQQEMGVIDAVEDDSSNEQVAETETLDTAVVEHPDAEDSKITLDATLNIQTVSHLYELLVVQLESQQSIEIDASAVVSIDTATLQLLIVLKQTAIKLHKEVIIDFPSDKFIEAAELLGLSEMLEVDQAAAGFF